MLYQKRKKSLKDTIIIYYIGEKLTNAEQKFNFVPTTKDYIRSPCSSKQTPFIFRKDVCDAVHCIGTEGVYAPPFSIICLWIKGEGRMKILLTIYVQYTIQCTVCLKK